MDQKDENLRYFPQKFFSSQQENHPEIDQIHSAHIRKNPLSAPAPNYSIQKIGGPAGPMKPPKQILEENSSSEEDENEINDPILKKAREQTNIEIQAEDAINDNNSKHEDDDDGEDNDEQENKNFSKKNPQLVDYKSLNIPCSHEVLLQGHSRSITALALDSNGIRIASGSYDYKVRLWDFEGMNKNMNSFRILEPITGHPIRNLCFNSSNHEILAIASNAQPKIINRDGKELLECIKGDMYIKDMNQTRGHVSMVYDGCFHPVEKHIFGSCSFDGTIRLWDRNMKLINIEQQLTHKQLLKCKDQKGLKTGVTAMGFSLDGGVIIGSCLDGSIQGFTAKNHYTRPDFIIPCALNTNTETSKMMFLQDNQRFCVRSMDHTMKIWDIRHTKKPLNVWYNLMNYSPGSKFCFSPDQKYILTGTSIRKNSEEEQSSILFYDSLTFEKVTEINMGACSITDIKWHPILNQIFVGIYFFIFYY